MTTIAPNDVRTLIPRIRRAVEGVVQAEWTLTDDEVLTIAADAIADLILYSGGGFTKTLDVTSTDTNGWPAEWATSDPLGVAEQSVIAASAALSYFFFKFAGLKVSETIADEASSYAYDLSPQLLTTQLKLLQTQRDAAIAALDSENIALDTYISFLHERDRQTSRYIEPWVYGRSEGWGGSPGGLEGDFRFDGLALGGGEFP